MTPDGYRELPALVLQSSVVFPDDVVSIQLPEDVLPRDLLKGSRGNDLLVATVYARRDSGEPKTVEDLRPVGVLCRVVQHMQVPGGGLQVVFQGVQRLSLEDYTSDDDGCRVQALLMPADPDPEEYDGKVLDCLDLVTELLGRESTYPDDLEQILRLNLEGAGRFADLVAAYINFPLPVKREIAATSDVGERIMALETALHLELARSKVDEDVHQRVRDNIDGRQREQYLRQQMRAIRDALGEDAGGEDEPDELMEKLSAMDVPDETRETCQREIRRLRSVAPSSAEYQVIRTYIGWILDLPWDTKSEDSIELDAARDALDEGHTGLEKVKERILEHLAVRKLNPGRPGAILCLVGPPGVGKTSIGRAVAAAMGRKFVRMSVGGLRDESEIKGHRRTYVGAMPGKLLQLVKSSGTRNPVLQIDEIDKMGADHRGDPSSALLEVLDPACNSEFRDHYLDLPFDLSDVFFLVTANVLDTIPHALRDRLEIVRLGGYTREEKVEIAQRHLLPRSIEKCGLGAKHVRFTARGLTDLVEGYTQEAGVRELERSIDSVCRKVATGFVRGDTDRVTVGRQRLEDLLGPRKFRIGTLLGKPEVGHVTGLAWTSHGGATLSIEATRMAGKGDLTTTGSLGDVMKESAHAAMSWIRSHADELDIQPSVFAETDIHIHFPEGATPKDGPSAGVAIATCLASLLSGRPVRHDLAMTGELTLRGRVLEVGGIKEKLLAAHRHGIKRVIVPRDNLKDVEQISAEVRAELEIIGSDEVMINICEALLDPAGHTPAGKVEHATTTQLRLDEPQ